MTGSPPSKSDQKLNVLTVTTFPLDDPAGGVNTMIFSLSETLAKDCGVVLLEFDWDAPRLSRRTAAGDAHYALRIRTPYDRAAPVRNAIGWLKELRGEIRQLRQLITDNAIDVIHLHYGTPYQYIFRVLRALTGVPYVLTLHRGDIMGYPDLDWPDRLALRFAIRGADRVIGVSAWLAEQARAALGPLPRLDVIQNGIDLAALDRLYDPDFSPDIGIEIPDRYVLMVSNVTHYKAQDVAIRAWAKVKEQHPDIPLLIVGGRREMWDQCERMIAELGCGDSIKLLGAQPRETAINLMHRAEAVLLPSRSEGLPYVLLEAGSIGTPLICSDIGPFIEVVEDMSTALIVPVEDHSALADAALRLIADPALGKTIGANLSRQVRADFSSDKMAQRYLAIYRDVLAGQRARQ